MKKVKVFNNNKFIVGVRFQNANGRETNIPPNAFVYMDEEDILYVNSVSSLFSKGIIYTEDQDMLEMMGYIEQNPNSVSEKEIKDILELGNARMKTELKKLTENHAIQKVISVVQEGQVDLTMAKIKIISETLDIDPELLHNDEELI